MYDIYKYVKKLQKDGYKYALPQDTLMGNSNDPIIKKASRVWDEGNELWNQRRNEIADIIYMLEAPYMIKDFDTEDGNFVLGRLAEDAINSHVEREDFLTWDLKAIEIDKPGTIDKSLQRKLEQIDKLTPEERTALLAQVADIKMKDMALAAGKKLMQEELEDAGFDRAWKGKFGVRLERARKGDAFIYIRERPKSKGDFEIINLKLSQIKVPLDATEWRDIREMVIQFTLTDYDDFRDEFPDNKKAAKLQWGDLPENEEDERLEYEWSGNKNQRRKGQYAIYLNWADEDNPIAVWYAGTKSTIFDVKEGKDYPFIDNEGNPTNPVYHFVYNYSPRGFYNFGLGDYFYQLNNLDQWNVNNKIIAQKKATNSYNMITCTDDNKSDTMYAIQNAEELRSQGKTAWIINSEKIGQQMITRHEQIGGGQPGLDASGYMDNLIMEKTNAGGITLQDVGAPSGKPLGSFQLELENANRKAREVGERNAEEFRRFMTDFYNLVVTFGNVNDGSPLDMDEEEFAPGEPMPNITRGLALKMLKYYKPFVTVEPLSGAIPNPVLEIAKLQNLYNFYQGTPEANNIANAIAKQVGYTPKSQEGMAQEEQMKAEASPEGTLPPEGQPSAAPPQQGAPPPNILEQAINV